MARRPVNDRIDEIHLRRLYKLPSNVEMGLNCYNIAIETCYPSCITLSSIQSQGHYYCKPKCLLGVKRGNLLLIQMNRHLLK